MECRSEHRRRSLHPAVPVERRDVLAQRERTASADGRACVGCVMKGCPPAVLSKAPSSDRTSSRVCRSGEAGNHESREDGRRTQPNAVTSAARHRLGHACSLFPLARRHAAFTNLQRAFTRVRRRSDRKSHPNSARGPGSGQRSASPRVQSPSLGMRCLGAKSSIAAARSEDVRSNGISRVKLGISRHLCSVLHDKVSPWHGRVRAVLSGTRWRAGRGSRPCRTGAGFCRGWGRGADSGRARYIRIRD